MMAMDDATIQKVAVAVAGHLKGTGNPSLPNLLSISETGRVLGVGRSTVYRLINSGQLQARHIGRRTLIPRVEVVRIQLDGS